ncbi:MAG: efflux RND transporter periplasmic adaptor subunit [Eubacteriales bacterium]|jgi:HlyD family secretion protein
MNKATRWTAAVMAGMLCILPLTACGGEVQEETQEIGIAVSLQQLQRGEMEDYIQVSSKVSAQNEVMVLPKVAGQVEKVQVQPGDAVREGQVLFVIDDTDYALALQQAQAGVGTAQAGLSSAQAQYESTVGGTLQSQLLQLESAMESTQLQYDELMRNLERTRQLYEVGGASKTDVEALETQAQQLQQQLESSRQTYELTRDKIAAESAKAAAAGVGSAQAGVNQAQAAYESAANQVSNTQVKAPISGVVGSCTVTEGSMASQSSVAMTIVDMDRVKLTINVADSVINKIQVGSQVYITIDALDGQQFEGTVSTVAPAADSQTMLYPVEIYIDNAQHLIKPGMFATVRLVLETKTDVISLPLDAVIEKNGETYVYVAGEDGRAKKVIVTTGMENSESVEILSGLEENDRVVVSGQDYLADGTLLEIIE